MKLGVLSDNHGRLGGVRAAVEIFDAERVDAVAHCGDLCGVETLEFFPGRPCWFVWGNMDVPEPTWRPWVEAAGAYWPEDVPVIIETEGKTIAMCHGHESVFAGVCESGKFDYVLHGHTHRRADHRRGRTRIINPGALYRTATKTVAILDIGSDDLQFFEIDAKHRD